jgi:hypothetical protein
MAKLKFNAAHFGFDGATYQTLIRILGLTDEVSHCNDGFPPAELSPGYARNVCLVGHGLDSDLRAVGASDIDLTLLSGLGVTSVFDTHVIANLCFDSDVESLSNFTPPILQLITNYART